MSFLTSMALRRPTVAVLAIILVLGSGVAAYRSLQVELFPQIDFPLVAVFVAYPSADPEAVVRSVTDPIERAISDTPELESIQSTSSEGRSAIFANFRYGTDMAEAQAAVEAAVGGVEFPDGVQEPDVGRFNPDDFPVIQVSVISDRPLPEIQEIVQSRIVPEVSGLDGVMDVSLAGTVDRSVRITVDAEKMAANGVPLFQVAGALRENNLTLPAGLLFDGSQAVIAKTTYTLESLQDIEDLIVGGSATTGPVRLADVATVTLGNGTPDSINRTNGKPGIGVSITKEPDANTVDVTTAVNDALDGIEGLPPDVEIVVVADQGPDIQRQIDTLAREAIFGFFFAVCVVFAFMFTIRPTVVRGFFNTLRPTFVIALSIPLSVLTGILLMFSQDMTLNFMTFGGLAISVGRVVDDSIVVLENVYRHIQGGRERWRAALEATTEVGPAIFASTMTTVVVFLPLAFIPGLFGAFFSPFALTVTFALIASLFVALTAVPVLGAYLLRPGDLPEGAGDEGELVLPETALQRVYTVILRWVLRHRLVTLLAAFAITVSSLGLTTIIPVNLFGGETDSLQIEVVMPPGSAPEQTLATVIEIEERLNDVSDLYAVTIGASEFGFFSGGGQSRRAEFFVTLRDDAPENTAEVLREELNRPGRKVSVTEIANGPPAGGVDIVVTGPDYDDIAVVSRELAGSLGSVEDIVNLENTVTQARPEVAIEVDPEKAAFLGLTTRQVALQLSLYLVGQTVTTVTIDGQTLDVVVSGDARAAGGLDGVGSLIVAGQVGSAPLAQIAELSMREGPVEISRTDGVRSAGITADIVGDDAQAVGVRVQEKIDALQLPAGVSVESGGIFADIAEGFQAVFISMAVGIVLVYLVMVASLGSLRNPFVIITTLPLALIGVFAALAVTGRSLGLPAMMGMLLLIGIVVTNAIVLIAFVEQQRAKGMGVYDALVSGARVRLRPILMTALTTSFALLPLAVATEGSGGLISAELATVVIGGLMSSTGLTLLVLPIVYMLFNDSIPRLWGRLLRRPQPAPDTAPAS
ncbi:MAG: efflux RND transporter permease subunit [Chloroflexota bacterium]|nr:efflux RND transporter permease subunit [Chloroflexota bacterium]MDE2884944.1 efflux RND transporter permease subunit [Chloroflexota bacterium]